MTKYFVLLFLLFDSLVVSAQHDLSGLDLDGDVTTWFDQSVGVVNLPVIEGSYFRVNRNSTISHQFFASDQWLEIEISYSDQEYYNFYGLYDVVDDILLLRHPIQNFYSQPINVSQVKIDWFKMDGHHFEYYHKNEAPENKEGFYHELLISDNIELVVKRKKIPKPSQGDLTIDFKNYDVYFLKYKDTFKEVSSRRSIIKELADYKKELRGFIRENLLKPKRGRDQDMVRLLKYCNTLISSIE